MFVCVCAFASVDVHSKFFLAQVAASLVDVIGRRPMLLAGASGMVVSLLALGACYLPLVQAFGTVDQVRAWSAVWHQYQANL